MAFPGHARFSMRWFGRSDSRLSSVHSFFTQLQSVSCIYAACWWNDRAWSTDINTRVHGRHSSSIEFASCPQEFAFCHSQWIKQPLSPSRFKNLKRRTTVEDAQKREKKAQGAENNTRKAALSITRYLIGIAIESDKARTRSGKVCDIYLVFEWGNLGKKKKTASSPSYLNGKVNEQENIAKKAASSSKNRSERGPGSLAGTKNRVCTLQAAVHARTSQFRFSPS